jgi:hypothetical protein
MFRALACVAALGLTTAAGGRAADPGPVRTVGPIRTTQVVTAGPGQKVALNPQPLPPRWRLWGARFATGKVSGGGPVPSPGQKVTLNPQPLPPRLR